MIEINNKKKLTLAITIYFSLILAIILIGQYDKLSGIFTSFLSVFSPIIIGFAAAYLLNPILKFFEKKVFKFIKNKKALRFVGVLCTYISFALFLMVLGLIVIPQVTKSISDLIGRFDTYKLTFIDAVNALLQKLKDADPCAAGGTRRP